MDRLPKILGAGFVASSPLSLGTAVFAADAEIKSDGTELRQDQKELYQDNREIRRDRRELHADFKGLKGDPRELRGDVKSGAADTEIPQDRKAICNARREIRGGRHHSGRIIGNAAASGGSFMRIGASCDTMSTT